MELQTQKREVFGRGVKTLRAQDLIPAELYGHGTENIHLSISKKDFVKVLAEAGESTLVDLVVDKKTHPVLIKDIHYHPITDQILNIDFYKVRMDEKISTTVELDFIGDSLAVKNLGGVLVKAVTELEVEALPINLPHDIKVDISNLADIGDSVHVKDLIIPDGVKVQADEDTVVATVTAQMTEEEDLAQGEATDLSSIEKEDEEDSSEKEAPDSSSNPDTLEEDTTEKS